jgi:hypothetical protein
MRSALILAAALTVAPAAAGAETLDGVAFDLPGDGWRVMDRPRRDSDVQTWRWERRAQGRTYLLEASAFQPFEPVASPEALQAWARRATNAEVAQPVAPDGLTCARADRRWSQTLSVNGAPSRPSADFDDHSLYCLSPVGDRLLVLRLSERLRPAAQAGDGAALAARLFASVRRSAD